MSNVVPSIVELHRSSTHIPSVIFDTYQKRAHHIDVAGMPLAEITVPYEERLFGAYPPMSCLWQLRKMQELGKFPPGLDIWNEAKVYSDAFIEGYFSFADDIVKPRTKIFNSDTDKARIIYHYALSRNILGGMNLRNVYILSAKYTVYIDGLTRKVRLLSKKPAVFTEGSNLSKEWTSTMNERMEALRNSMKPFFEENTHYYTPDDWTTAGRKGGYYYAAWYEIFLHPDKFVNFFAEQNPIPGPALETGVTDEEMYMPAHQFIVPENIRFEDLFTVEGLKVFYAKTNDPFLKENLGFHIFIGETFIMPQNRVYAFVRAMSSKRYFKDEYTFHDKGRYLSDIILCFQQAVRNSFNRELKWGSIRRIRPEQMECVNKIEKLFPALQG